MRTNYFAIISAWFFGIIGVVALVGSYWNEWQLVNTFVCAVMVWFSVIDLKNSKKDVR